MLEEDILDPFYCLVEKYKHLRTEESTVYNLY